jgi:mono/diheme cytochrome c family protein
MGRARRRAEARAKALRRRLAAAAVAVAAVVVVALVALAGSSDEDDGGGPVDAAALYQDRCAACHGARGEGLTGPRLADGAAVARFPDVADQIELVEQGASNMPPFGDVLSDEELRAVVEYTRSL